jgi:AraC-like DNA-binding protein
MFKVYRFRREAAHQAPLDSHAEGQAFVLTEGAIRFGAAERIRVLTPGRLCWVPPHLPHGFTSYGPVAGISVKVSVSDLPPLPCVLKPDPFYRAVLERMLARPDTMAVLWPVLAEAIQNDAADDLSLPSPRDARLVRVAEAMMRRPADDRDLKAWADMANLSPRSLMRHFVVETGLSFTAWRRRLRLIHAIGLMEDGASATSAALDSGFAGSSAFSAAFRLETGLSPTSYLSRRGTA